MEMPKVTLMEIIVPIPKFTDILRVLRKIKNDSVLIIYTEKEELSNATY